MRIDKEAFAQSVLMSERKELTLEEKLALYLKAITLAEGHNKQYRKTKKTSSKSHKIEEKTTERTETNEKEFF